MSCTFFIKGMLKKKYKANDLFDVIIESIKDTEWKYKIQNDESLEILFNDRSEILSIKFRDNKIDEICKIHFETNLEFEKLLAIFYNIKGMFYILQIDDDFGLWNDYLANKNPCKIKLRELSEEEKNEIKIFDYKKHKSINIIYGFLVKSAENYINNMKKLGITFRMYILNENKEEELIFNNEGNINNPYISKYNKCGECGKKQDTTKMV